MRFPRPLAMMATCLVAAATANAAPPGFFDRQDYPFNPWAVADVNGDGIPDMIGIANVAGYGVIVSFGNGDGTFRAGPTSTTDFYGTLQLADVNGDGKLDLVSVGSPQSNGISTDLAINLGNGDGTFALAKIYPDSVNDNLLTLVVADFNDDGIPDTAAAGGQGVWVSLGTEGGAFSPGVLYAVSGAQSEGLGGVLSGDFNHDGIPDLAELTNTVSRSYSEMAMAPSSRRSIHCLPTPGRRLRYLPQLT